MKLKSIIDLFNWRLRADVGWLSPGTIASEKAPTYATIVESMGWHAFYSATITHMNMRGRNIRIDSHHVPLKHLIDPGIAFHTQRTVKGFLVAMKAIRTIKRGDLFEFTTTVGSVASHKCDVHLGVIRRKELPSYRTNSRSTQGARRSALLVKLWPELGKTTLTLDICDVRFLPANNLPKSNLQQGCA